MNIYKLALAIVFSLESIAIGQGFNSAVQNVSFVSYNI